MKKEDAIRHFFPMCDDITFGRVFIGNLYKQGCVIIAPKERKKIDGLLVLAHVCGLAQKEDA